MQNVQAQLPLQTEIILKKLKAAGNETENCDVMLDCSKHLKNLSLLMVLNSINFQVPMLFKIKQVNLQNVSLNFDFWPLS